MDSLKKYLAALKKHHFWVLLAVLAIASLVGWKMATADLQAQTEQQRNYIKQRFNNVEPYTFGNPPNEEFKEAVDKLSTDLETQVFDAWKLIAEDQANILQWPETVKSIGELPPGSEIPEPTRADYRNLVIEPEFQRLFSLLDLRRRKGGEPAPRPQLGAPAPPVELEGVLVWDQRNRDLLVSRYLTNTTPSSLRVRLTQEDLWCFESLFRIIKSMNVKATDPLNAIIKRIDYLDIGQYAVREAARNPGKIWLTPDATLEILSGGSALAEEDDMTDDQKLIHGRYLDENNQPVPYDVYQDNPPFAEFKQMFVQMKFLMDQRAVPELLAACANSPLPIEVRQVRMNLDQVDMARGGKAPAIRVGGAAAAEGQVERSAYDVDVELRGIIFVYTPPNLENLGTGSAENPAHRAFGIPLPLEE